MARVGKVVQALASRGTAKMSEGRAFYVFEDRAGEWRWSLVAANKEIVADSGEGYSSRQV